MSWCMQLVKRANYKATVRDPGTLGVLTMTENKFVLAQTFTRPPARDRRSMWSLNKLHVSKTLRREEIDHLGFVSVRRTKLTSLSLQVFVIFMYAESLQPMRLLGVEKPQYLLVLLMNKSGRQK
ncbi:hypothetical protein GBA52_016123 [Prunus armeniaca]|nr:hypothetical protein GBA52_016123 [Prunus armeniaca]